MRRNHVRSRTRRAGQAVPWRENLPTLRRLLVVGTSLLAVGLIVAACGSSGSSGGGGGTGTNSAGTHNANLGTVIYGTLPPPGTPVAGGTITQGQLTGQTPTYIFPIVPGAQTSTGTISLLTSLFMPLYAGPTGAIPKVNYAMSAANPLKFSNGNKTVTIPIKIGRAHV